MAERDEETEEKSYELSEAIEGIFSPYKMRAPFEEAFRLFLASEVDAGQLLFDVYWSLTERNVLAKVLEEAIDRTIDRNVPFTDRPISILSDDVNEPEADLPRDLEKTILQTILRREDGSYISWEDIEEYELILSARQRHNQQ